MGISYAPPLYAAYALVEERRIGKMAHLMERLLWSVFVEPSKGDLRRTSLPKLSEKPRRASMT
jgi:hypothetical protein